MAQTFLPLARRSAITESMPFFSMVRRPRVETRRLTQRRSPSSQKRWVCRFGRKRRRFLLLAWETRWPTATLLPVTSQTRLIKVPRISELTIRRPACGRQRAVFIPAGLGNGNFPAPKLEQFPRSAADHHPVTGNQVDGHEGVLHHRGVGEVGSHVELHGKWVSEDGWALPPYDLRVGIGSADHGAVAAVQV